MALIDSLIVFVVSLLVGAFGIYLGARVVTDREDHTYTAATAFLARSSGRSSASCSAGSRSSGRYWSCSRTSPLSPPDTPVAG